MPGQWQPPLPAVNSVRLELRALRKSYGGHPVLGGLSLQISPGECYALLGPNGAGKSTTIRAIQGLTPLDGGEVLLDGRPVDEWPGGGRGFMGIVPQSDNLDPDFTVSENLRVYGRYYGLSSRVVQQRMTELLEFVSLQEAAQRPIQALSGGMKRRLTIARALIHQPRLLLLDEPSTGLDPQARHLIWQRLRDLRRQGVTLLLTTHYLEEAERLADRVGIIDHGRLLAEDSPAALIQTHIPGEVLEVRRQDGMPPDPGGWHQGQVAASERAGDTLLLYGPDLSAVRVHFAGDPDVRLLSRQATLEDVFLRLTGRELREEENP